MTDAKPTWTRCPSCRQRVFNDPIDRELHRHNCLAGLRRGLAPDTRSGLWSHYALAIAALRPSLVIVENVRGLLSATAHSDLEPDPWGLGVRPARPALRALGAVLGDLADLGYDAEWTCVRASDAGAPHARERVFLIAWTAEDADIAARGQRRLTASGEAQGGWTWADACRRGGTPAAYADHDAARSRFPGRDTAGQWPELAQHGRPAADSANHDSRRGARTRTTDRGTWGKYGPAIARWETTLGREAPPPTKRGRLSPVFVEWMMGLPAGHITEVGLTRSRQLRVLGNGVVPQQAALALTALLGTTASEAAA